jgi:hypothetical protein
MIILTVLLLATSWLLTLPIAAILSAAIYAIVVRI